MEIVVYYTTSLVKQEFKSNVLVLERFANAFYSNTSMKKTHLHLASRLRWDSFNTYLEWLLSKNYVERFIDDGKEKYQLTEKGREMFSRLLEFLECVKLNKSINVL
ncbi:MAG: winged helix-turn-helix domain-containing protein [Nitrosotalea sp.]